MMIERRRIYILFWIMSIICIKNTFVSAEALFSEEPVKDFGVATEGDKVSQTFIVKNPSNKALTVDRIITTCGCITPRKKGFTLKPDESIDIPVEFNTAGYGGQNSRKI